MATFPIRIDARQTSFDQFFIPGTGAFEAKTVQTFTLAPGTFGFQVGSGVAPSFQFRVSNSGVVDQFTPNGAASFVDGLGTSDLVVKGFDITLDARCLSTGVLLANTDGQFHSLKTLRLVPGHYFGVQDLSGGVTKVPFEIDINGRVTLTNTREAGVSVATQNTIQYDGFLILIDARGVDQVRGNHVDGVGLSGNTAQVSFVVHRLLLVALLPGEFEVQLTSGIGHSGVIFSIDREGTPNADRDFLNLVQGVKIPAFQVARSERPCVLPLC